MTKQNFDYFKNYLTTQPDDVTCSKSDELAPHFNQAEPKLKVDPFDISVKQPVYHAKVANPIFLMVTPSKFFCEISIKFVLLQC